MGFNKRYIRKEMILENVSNINFICKLVNADALIIDTWSSNFYDNFNFKCVKYNKIREVIKKDIIFNSHHNNVLNHENYKELFNLSNVLLNLKTDPSWVDVLLTGDILNEIDTDFMKKKDTPKEITGRFDELVIYHIKLIEEYYG